MSDMENQELIGVIDGGFEHVRHEISELTEAVARIAGSLSDYSPRQRAAVDMMAVLIVRNPGYVNKQSAKELAVVAVDCAEALFDEIEDREPHYQLTEKGRQLLGEGES